MFRLRGWKAPALGLVVLGTTGCAGLHRRVAPMPTAAPEAAAAPRPVETVPATQPVSAFAEPGGGIGRFFPGLYKQIKPEPTTARRWADPFVARSQSRRDDPPARTELAERTPTASRRRPEPVSILPVALDVRVHPDDPPTDASARLAAREVPEREPAELPAPRSAAPNRGRVNGPRSSWSRPVPRPEPVADPEPPPLASRTTSELPRPAMPTPTLPSPSASPLADPAAQRVRAEGEALSSKAIAVRPTAPASDGPPSLDESEVAADVPLRPAAARPHPRAVKPDALVEASPARPARSEVPPPRPAPERRRQDFDRAESNPDLAGRPRMPLKRPGDALPDIPPVEFPRGYFRGQAAGKMAKPEQEEGAKSAPEPREVKPTSLLKRIFGNRIVARW